MNNSNVRIVYTDPSTGMLAVVYPTGEESLEITAKLSVPKGVSYWIVSEDDIPKDRSFRDAWEIDLSKMPEPDGEGGF
jgi:hypothetical protein